MSWILNEQAIRLVCNRFHGLVERVHVPDTAHRQSTCRVVAESVQQTAEEGSRGSTCRIPFTATSLTDEWFAFMQILHQKAPNTAAEVRALRSLPDKGRRTRYSAVDSRVSGVHFSSRWPKRRIGEEDFVGSTASAMLSPGGHCVASSVLHCDGGRLFREALIPAASTMVRSARAHAVHAAVE